jgi:hypothetical protein
VQRGKRKRKKKKKTQVARGCLPRRNGLPARQTAVGTRLSTGDTSSVHDSLDIVTCIHASGPAGNQNHSPPSGPKDNNELLPRCVSSCPSSSGSPLCAQQRYCRTIGKKRQPCQSGGAVPARWNAGVIRRPTQREHKQKHTLGRDRNCAASHVHSLQSGNCVAPTGMLFQGYYVQHFAKDLSGRTPHRRHATREM